MSQSTDVNLQQAHISTMVIFFAGFSHTNGVVSVVYSAKVAGELLGGGHDDKETWDEYVKKGPLNRL